MFSVLLKELRGAKGMTQGQLAKAVGVSPGNVGDWETGKSKPGYNALAALARIFEVSADRLLEIEPPLEKEGMNLSEFKAEQGLACDGLPLDDAEVDLVAMFRLLPPSHQEDVFDLVYFKYKRHVEQKKESIYWTYHGGSGGAKSGPADGLETRDGTACFFAPV